MNLVIKYYKDICDENCDGLPLMNIHINDKDFSDKTYTGLVENKEYITEYCNHIDIDMLVASSADIVSLITNSSDIFDMKNKLKRFVNNLRVEVIKS